MVNPPPGALPPTPRGEPGTRARTRKTRQSCIYASACHVEVGKLGHGSIGMATRIEVAIYMHRPGHMHRLVHRPGHMHRLGQ